MGTAIVVSRLNGAQLCAKHQPQRVTTLVSFGLTGVLRLLSDTAALRPLAGDVLGQALFSLFPPVQ